MKKTFLSVGSVILVALGLAAQGCDQPKIFAGREGEKLVNSPAPPLENAFVYLHVTGGIMGLDWRLAIYENGVVRWAQDFPHGETRQDRLKAETLGEIRAAFVDNDFFSLRDRYITDNAEDLFYYRLTYRQDGSEHTVVADDLAAPRSLQNILELLRKQVDMLQTNGLHLSLAVSADTLRPGESVELKLVVQNISGTALAINFPTSQRFDFFAVDVAGAAASEGMDLLRQWSWSYGREFLTVIGEMTLQPGEVQEMSVSWDGRNNEGILKQGTFWVGGELPGYPGGTTPLHKIVILP